MSLISSKLECRSNFGVRRRGSHVESLRVVSRVEKEIRNLNRRYRDENVKDPKRRVLRRLGEDLTKLCNGLDGSDEADNVTMDRLERAALGVRNAACEYGATLEDGVPLDVPNARAFAEKCAVTKLAAIRGLESEEAIEDFLEHLDVVVEWRRGRAAHAKQVKEIGRYARDKKGRRVHTPPKAVAAKNRRGKEYRADPMASRLRKGGHGLQNTADGDKRMRTRQEYEAKRSRKRARRYMKSLKPSLTHDMSIKLPPGVVRRPHGKYAVGGHIAEGRPNPSSTDLAEVAALAKKYSERKRPVF